MRAARLFFLLLLGVASCAPVQAQQPAETVVFLVRHAEKASDDPRDPSLTAEGQTRAQLLAAMLAQTNIDHIYSTDYKRTQQTVAPLSEKLGVEIESYDPRDLEGFAEALRQQPGRLLISGHSNTTPQLVAALGGEPGEPIVEETEYDRLYILTIASDGSVSTVLLRFGAPGS